MVDVHVQEIVSNALLIRTHLGKMMNRFASSIFIPKPQKYLLAHFHSQNGILYRLHQLVYNATFRLVFDYLKNIRCGK